MTIGLDVKTAHQSSKNGADQAVALQDNEIRILLPKGTSVQELSLQKVEALIFRAYELFGVKDDRAYVHRDKDGRPFLRPGASIDIVTYTDCHDTETAARNDARFLGKEPEDTNARFHLQRPVQNFSTLHLAVIVSSFFNERKQIDPADQTPVLVLGNAAPRSGNNPKSIGNLFVFAELTNNVFYGGTIEGLSLVKDSIVNQRVFVWNIEVQNAQTVYRSRYLQETAIKWLNRDENVFTGEVGIDKIPNLSGSFVYSIDNFGNIKTGLTDHSEVIKSLQLGKTYKITINGITRQVRFGGTLGDVEEGALVLAKGSTEHSDGRLYDIYQNNGNAAQCFTPFWGLGRKPSIGGDVLIESLDGRPLGSGWFNANRRAAA